MAYIYKITNDINGKIYVGKTEFSIEKRFKEHCKDALKETNEKRPLYSAMKKYGVEHFHIELVEECSWSSASNRERYWIEYFGSFKYGYNATLGGDGRPYLDYDLIYCTYQEIKSIKKTSELCHCDAHSVATILSNYGISQQERLKNRGIQNWKPVARLDKNTREVLEIFDSIEAASKAYPNTNKHISTVCKGKRKSAGGYGWKYLS